MTPKEKAKELVEKHLTAYDIEPIAVKSALITINEMLDFRNALYINEGSLAHQYLIEVKHEIDRKSVV